MGLETKVKLVVHGARAEPAVTRVEPAEQETPTTKQAEMKTSKAEQKTTTAEQMVEDYQGGAGDHHDNIETEQTEIIDGLNGHNGEFREFKIGFHDCDRKFREFIFLVMTGQTENSYSVTLAVTEITGTTGKTVSSQADATTLGSAVADITSSEGAVEVCASQTHKMAAAITYSTDNSGTNSGTT